MRILVSSTFKKAFETKTKKNKTLKEKFYKALEIFMNDPFAPQLKTHKLSGVLKDLWSFSVEYNIRVIFYFQKDPTGAVLVNFGTHDETY